MVVAVEDGTTITTSTGDAALDAFDAWTFTPGSDTEAFFVGSDKPVAVFSGTDCVLIPGDPWYACDHLEEQVVPLASWGTSYVGARHPQRVPDINPAPEEVRWRVVGAVDGTTVHCSRRSPASAARSTSPRPARSSSSPAPRASSPPATSRSCSCNS
ncbi:IgGFc-binding protein [Nannocystis pusilla]|uniref:IgGFc-binding protein n=1 Tax=Nannocystis pusilla TaxID=889268 RepID=UPI003B7BE531